MINSNRALSIVYRNFLFGVLLLINVHKVSAGPIPMPLEAQLDMSEYVFIGKNTQIEKSEFRKSEGIQWGCAKAEVKETLKGVPTKFVEFYAATGFDDPNYKKAASPPKIYRVGMSGILLVGADNVVLHSCGLLAESRKSDIQRIIKNLSERKWSRPVNGLQAWAAAVKSDYSENPVIIFAVKNVSDSDIFVPLAHESGFIKATAINDKGEKFNYVLGNVSTQDETVFCSKLPANQIVYLHPQYSCIDLAKHQKLPHGKYSVIIQCNNKCEGCMKITPAKIEHVSAWKGELQAESVELVVKSKK